MTRRLAALLVGCFVALGALTSAALAEYRLGVGDKVRIKVYEWPDLNGEYAISPAGTVFLSVVGEVRAEDATPSELAASISSSLKNRARLATPPGATVEIVQFRPFFIIGDVQSPGEYPYRPGLTAIQALSIAGGIFRRQDVMGRGVEREAITSVGALHLLEMKRIQFQTRIARLDAQLAGEDTIDFPPVIIERKDEPMVTALIEEERLLLELNREAHAEEQATERDLQALLRAEIETLGRELDSIDNQLRSAQKEYEDVRSLVERGLAPAPRQLGLERTVANIAAQRSAIESSILRARQSVRQSEQKAIALAVERREKALTERRQTRNDLEAAAREITTMKRLILELEEFAPDLVRDTNTSNRYSFRIIRGSDEAEEIDRMTPIMPGDILEVLRDNNLERGRPGTTRVRPTDLSLFQQSGEGMRR